MGKMVYSDRDLTIMALTMWAEARSETNEGLAAVAWTIRNRAEADLWGDGKPDWWGEGIAGVCLKPWQFSCWNAGDPQSARLRSMLTGGSTDAGSLNAKGLADRRLQDCLVIARGVLDGAIEDPTQGATHYYADYIATPGWAKGKSPSVTIGRHRFFSDVEPGYAPKAAKGKGGAAPAPTLVTVGLPANVPAKEPAFEHGRYALMSQLRRVEGEIRELRKMIEAEAV